jgi:hypothetical protein
MFNAVSQGLQASANISLDLDERPMPKGPLFPRFVLSLSCARAHAKLCKGGEDGELGGLMQELRNRRQVIVVQMGQHHDFDLFSVSNFAWFILSMYRWLSFIHIAIDFYNATSSCTRLFHTVLQNL